jgi:hypothetical protein
MQARLTLLACACLALALPGAAIAETVTITLTSWTTIETQHLVPHHTNKPQKGDFIDFRDLLLNRAKAQFGKKPGHAVAWDEGLVRYTSATSTSIIVLVTFPDVGTITYAGPLVSDKHGDQVVPITAATGAFKGARGTVMIGPGANTAPNTFHFTIPGNGLDISSAGGAA